MRVLVACELSGRVRDALINRGHNAWSCDILPGEGRYRENHIQGDVTGILTHGWDMMIAFPPCTYLSVSGLHWNKRIPSRVAKTEDALKFVALLMGAPIPMVALENPVGCISSRIRKPDQIIQPYQFGDDASKKTCLWLKGLSKLVGGDPVHPRVTATGKHRWSNQTDSGQNRLGPSPTRSKERATTYPGIARAMAEQWTKEVTDVWA